MLRRFGRGSGGGRARGVLRAWQAWESLASRLWKAPLVPRSPHGVLRLRSVTYHGTRVTLPDGTRVMAGDVVGEIHIQNRALSAVTVKSPWHILRAFREELVVLSAWTLQSDFPTEIQAFHAISLLGRAARGLGFTVYPRGASIGNRFEKLYMLGLLEIYSHDGGRRLERGGTKSLFPDDIWISRRMLIRLYGPDAPPKLSGLSAPTDGAE